MRYTTCLMTLPFFVNMSSHFICEKREFCATNRQKGQKRKKKFYYSGGGGKILQEPILLDTCDWSAVNLCNTCYVKNVLCYNWSNGQSSCVGRPSSLLFQSLILFDFNHHGNGQRGGERGCNCKVRVVSVQQEGRRLRSGLTGGSATDREL